MAIRQPSIPPDDDHEHAHEHGRVAERELSSVRAPIGVAQIVTPAIGILFVVLGTVGLARTGLNSMTRPVTAVGVFSMTPMLAIIHLAIGLIMLGGAADRGIARGATLIFGPAFIAFGIVALIQPIHSLGWRDANGVLYVIAGVVALVAGMLTPLAITERTRSTVGTTDATF